MELLHDHPRRGGRRRRWPRSPWPGPTRGNAIDLRWRASSTRSPRRGRATRPCGPCSSGPRADLLRRRRPQELRGAGDDLPAHLTDITTHLHAAISRLPRMDAPVVAAVQGSAAGGGVGLAARRRPRAGGRVEPASCWPSRPSASPPDSSSTWSLPRLVGLRRALDLALTNRRARGRGGGGRGPRHPGRGRRRCWPTRRSPWPARLAGGPDRRPRRDEAAAARARSSRDLEAQIALETDVAGRRGGTRRRTRRASPPSSKAPPRLPRGEAAVVADERPARREVDPRVRRPALRAAGLPGHRDRRDRRGGRHHRPRRLPPLRQQERRARRGRAAGRGRGGRRGGRRRRRGPTRTGRCSRASSANMIDLVLDDRAGWAVVVREQRHLDPAAQRALGRAHRAPHRGVGARAVGRPTRPHRRRGAGRSSTACSAWPRRSPSGAHDGPGRARTAELLAGLGDGRAPADGPSVRLTRAQAEVGAGRGAADAPGRLAEQRGHHHRVDACRRGLRRRGRSCSCTPPRRGSSAAVHDDAGLGLAQVGPRPAEHADPRLDVAPLHPVEPRAGLGAQRAPLVHGHDGQAGVADDAVHVAAGQGVDHRPRAPCRSP